MIGCSRSREQKTSIIPPFRLIYAKTQLHVMHLSLSLSKLSSSQLVAGWRPAVFSTNLAIQATGGSIQTSKTTTLHLYNRRDRDNLTLNRPNYKAASAHDLASWDVIAKRQTLMKQPENSIYPASQWRDQGSFRGEHQQGTCQQFDKYKRRHKYSTAQISVQGLAPCVTRTELQCSGRLALHVWWILRSNTEDNIVYRSKICHIYDL